MYKVFLVDDEELVRKEIRRTIETEIEGFCVCGDAGDGEQALPEVLKTQPDILLTDIKMPFMDGLELGRIVKKELPRTAFLIMTGYDEFEYARQGILIGASDYILKPITPVKLVQALERVAKTLEEEKDQRKKERLLSRTDEMQLELSGSFFQDMNGEIKRETIVNFLQFASEEEAEKFARKLADASWRISGGSLVHFMYCAYDIMLTAGNLANRMGIDAPFVQEPGERSLKLENQEDFVRVIGGFLRQIIRYRLSMADTKTRLVAEAKEYIEKHYENCDLTLSMTAEAVGVTSNYLSTLLSKETGETFSEYLNKVRIRQAIVYLKTTDMTFQEIALKIGYRDGYYFSRMFKKIMGVSPKVMKKM